MKMTECIVQTRKRKITSGTKEWADHNVNCLKGCYNNCRYCYAKIMAKRFGRNTHDTWKNMEVREDVVRKSFRKLSGRVMFPSSHDIFDISPFKEACFIILEKLLESGNEILITTKPRFNIIQDIDLKFSRYKEQMQFRLTITSSNDRRLEFWEPNAPRFKERLACLKYAFQKGFKTSVSIEPFLDYDPSELVENITHFTTDSIWIGRMNYIPRKNLSKDEEPYYYEIRKNYETHHLWELYTRLNGNSKIRFKDSIINQLARAQLSKSKLNKRLRTLTD
ncbi:MAG: radical SAM protein [Candidatus Hodarchaeota archaeon]